jgi:hypothetical protein
MCMNAKKNAPRALACLLAAAALTSVQAQGGPPERCSAATLKGGYGYTVTGALTAGPNAGPFAAVGRFSFDGLSTFQNVRTISRNGTILPQVAGAGTYVVNSDCTGSITFTDGGVVTLATDLVIDDDGDGIRMIATSPGTALVVSGRKQISRGK